MQGNEIEQNAYKAATGNTLERFNLALDYTAGMWLGHGSGLVSGAADMTNGVTGLWGGLQLDVPSAHDIFWGGTPYQTNPGGETLSLQPYIGHAVESSVARHAAGR